ncbi:uncharacterized protein LOC123382667 [Felis catus]|uniref:uncharacterized protein LOC123382667 n=1 Tax=Felis catus TaxID=9685 RepID=UPI001D1A1ADF|nr:uncharacterized protein LOC123382667 [Felis catus]
MVSDDVRNLVTRTCDDVVFRGRRAADEHGRGTPPIQKLPAGLRVPRHTGRAVDVLISTQLGLQRAVDNDSFHLRNTVCWRSLSATGYKLIKASTGNAKSKCQDDFHLLRDFGPSRQVELPWVAWIEKDLAPRTVKSLPWNVGPVILETSLRNEEGGAIITVGMQLTVSTTNCFFITFFLLAGSSVASQRGILPLLSGSGHASYRLKGRAIFIPDPDTDKLVDVLIPLGSKRLWKKAAWPDLSL